jgi:hypothetical protein
LWATPELATAASPLLKRAYDRDRSWLTASSNIGSAKLTSAKAWSEISPIIECVEPIR